MSLQRQQRGQPRFAFLFGGQGADLYEQFKRTLQL
jgi:hypothetical protein